MIDNQVISNKLKVYFNECGIQQKDIAERLGVSQAAVSALLNGKPFGKRVAERWGDEFEIKPSWLITGEGEMLKDSSSRPLDDRDAQVQTIPLLPISAQAGKLNDFVVSVKNSDCERIVSPIRGADFAMTVAGDSMAPEYPNGSQILIKKITSTSFLEWGKVYVLDTCDGSVVKIVTPSKIEGCIRCVSINADQNRYAPFDVPASEVFGIYRVMLCMAMK